MEPARLPFVDVLERNKKGADMFKAVGWIVFIIFLIGLLVVLGLLGLIF